MTVTTPPGEPVRRAVLARAYAADAARSVARLATRRRHRDRAQVAKEYDDGTWRAVLDRRAWEKAVDLEDFLVGASRATSLRVVEGRVRSVGDDDYYRWRLRSLQTLVAAAAGGSHTLVELGSGFGYNLFALALDPRWQRLRGLDISTNGIEAARAVTAQFQLDHVSFDRIDLTDPADHGFDELAGQAVLTFFALEQLPLHVGQVVASILAAGPARVIHVESAAGLLGRRRPRDLLNALYVRSRDYQLRLLGELRTLEAAGRLRVLRTERLDFAATIHNDAAMVVWEPTVR